MFNLEIILGTIKKLVFNAEEKNQTLWEVEEHGTTSNCRQYDVAMSLFSKWKRQYNENGIDGLQVHYNWFDPAVL